MQLSARGAQKRKDSTKKLSMYSKQWTPGDTLRTFYPIYWEDGKPEIAVGAVWGHKVNDIKALGLKTAFIPSTTDFDENGFPVGVPDITYQFCQIAPLFTNGQKASEEAAIAKKNFPTESARREALKAIDDKYDTKNNMQAVRPILGRPTYYITTEVVSVKIANDAPNAESIAVTSAPLSQQTITRLYAIMDDPKYAPAEGEDYLEVEWKYPMDTSKAKSAQSAAPAGVTSEYKLVNHAPVVFGTIKNSIESLARDCETIVRRATRTVNPDRVRQAVTNYAFMNSEYLDVLGDEDEETLLKHVDLVHELDLPRALTNADLIEKINSAIIEMDNARPTLQENAVPELSAPKAESDAPSLDALLAAQNAAPTVSEPTPEPAPNPIATPGINGAVANLLNNVNLAESAEADLEAVDFGAMV